MAANHQGGYVGVVDEDDGIVSLPDYLESENAIEESAQAVLGGGDVHHCSYDKVRNHS